MVTASGEIKPTTYTNVTAQGFGRITDILVKEGDHIKKGERLLLQENVQANADVQAQAAIDQFAMNPACRQPTRATRPRKSDLIQQEANLEKAKLDYDRGQGLYKDGLIPKQDYRPAQDGVRRRSGRGGGRPSPRAVAESAIGSNAGRN